MNSARRLAAASLAVLSLGAMSACSSQPGDRRVVSDVIESLGPPNTALSEPEEQCMLDKLDTYTDDELEQIANDNENWDPAAGNDTPDDASEGMQLFIADYEECTREGGAPAPSSSAQGSTEPTDTTETIDTTG